MSSSSGSNVSDEQDATDEQQLSTAALTAAAATKIQALVRRRIAAKRMEYVKKSKKLESLRRMKASREKRKRNKAAVKIQALVRGALQRPKYRQALEQQRQTGGIQEEIERLKAKLAKTEEERERAAQDAEARIAEATANAAALAADEQHQGLDQAEVEQVSQRARLEESEKVLDFLRRERQRLMALVKTHKGRCERIVEQEHKALREATNQIASRQTEVENYILLQENNKATLARNKEAYEKQLSTYRKELQKGQAYKRNEEAVGKVYQNAVERIVALVQEQSNQDELVEDIYMLALEAGDLGDMGPEFTGGESVDELLDDLLDDDDLEMLETELEGHNE